MALRVKALREALERFPDDMLVVMSKDGEGNSFSPLADMGAGVYEPDSTWSGDFQTHNPEGTRRIPVKKRNALCLWPTN